MVLLCMELMTMIICDTYCLAEELVQGFKQDRSDPTPVYRFTILSIIHP